MSLFKKVLKDCGSALEELCAYLKKEDMVNFVEAKIIELSLS